MSILVIAEHDNSELKPSTLSAVTAAQNLGEDIHVLAVGNEHSPVIDSLTSVKAVSKVLKAESPDLEHQLAEDLTPLIVKLAESYSHILAPATTFGKNLMPCVAALLDTQQISDIIEIIDANTFKRPVYGGQGIASVKSSDNKKVITVRATAFDRAETAGGSAEVQDIAVENGNALSSFVKMEVSESDRPELTSAGIIVSGGRGVGSAENFAIVEKLADKLGAAVGASRAAVDAGYVPNDYQVGQTGKVVAPDLYIAVGISGAIQHLAGMKDSKIIVAINKDEEAPIFQVADYGLVADLFEAVPELESKL